MEIPEKNWKQISSETAYTDITSLVLLVLLIFLSSLISFSILLGMSTLVGENFSSISEKLSQNNELSLRNFTRMSLFVQHLFLFIIPAFAFSYIVYRKDGFSFLKLKRLPSFINLSLGSLLIILAFPLAQLTFQLNKKIPLPAWAQSIEDETVDLVNSLLLVEVPYEFYFNLFVMAIIPALGEELIFRGIIQQKLHKILDNPIWAILITAFLFSAFHMQFEGFLPRFLLGAMLGFIFYSSRNLWIAIFAHFIFNASQIFVHKFYQDKISDIDLENMEALPWGINLISLILVLGLSYFFVKINKKQLEL